MDNERYFLGVKNNLFMGKDKKIICFLCLWETVFLRRFHFGIAGCSSDFFHKIFFMYLISAQELFFLRGCKATNFIGFSLEQLSYIITLCRSWLHFRTKPLKNLVKQIIMNNFAAQFTAR